MILSKPVSIIISVYASSAQRVSIQQPMHIAVDRENIRLLDALFADNDRMSIGSYWSIIYLLDVEYAIGHQVNSQDMTQTLKMID